MRIGVDFDNTIVDYGNVFYKVARELGWVPERVGKDKSSVKSYLQLNVSADKWTELQGMVYGKHILLAPPFKQLNSVILSLISKNHEIFIVSHKTLNPYLGKKVNLHNAARTWINRYLMIGDSKLINQENIFFEISILDKIRRIKSLNLDVFIDDLPEILSHAEFPASTRKILFGKETFEMSFEFEQCSSWSKIEKTLNDFSN